jgi:hypothetical protein
MDVEPVDSHVIIAFGGCFVSMDRDLYTRDGLFSEGLQSVTNFLFDDSISR